MPQIVLTDAFQDVSGLAEPREFYLSGAAPGTVVAVEAGASLVATEGAEIGRLEVPNPAVFGAAGTTTFVYPGSAQFLRYRVVEGSVVGADVWVSGALALAPPSQITLTDAFQDVSALGEPREFFLSGAPNGTVVVVEAGATIGASAGVEVARLPVPNPSVSGATGTRASYAGSAQFLRYRVESGDLPIDAVVWMSGADPGGVSPDGDLVLGSVPSTDVKQLVLVYPNNAAEDQALRNVAFVSLTSIPADISNYWVIGLVDVVTQTLVLRYDTRPPPDGQGAIAGNQRVVLLDMLDEPTTEVVVAAGGAVALQIEPHGSPPKLGGSLQCYPG